MQDNIVVEIPVAPDKTGEEQVKKVKAKPFEKGVSGNPKGRPKGSISIKDKVRQYLEKNPDEVEEIVKHFVKKNRELMWQMLEGSPARKTTLDGKLELPISILGNEIPSDHSNQEDSSTD
jgi:hypothetical protein